MSIKTAALTIEDVCEHVADRDERDAYESCLPYFQGALRQHDEEVASLEAERDKLRELLRKCEWGVYHDTVCPSCGRHSNKLHDADCELAAALNTGEKR